MSELMKNVRIVSQRLNGIIPRHRANLLGVAAADVNNDGWPDFFLASAGGGNVLIEFQAGADLVAELRSAAALGSTRSSSPGEISPDQSVPVTTVPAPATVNARST